MNDSAPHDISRDALLRLLDEALRVGGSAAPPEPPEWWNDPAFPYVVVSYVGRGGSGFVWKASRRDGRGFVALKLVPFRADPIRLQQRWEDECAALAKIQHPNLVALYDHGRSPDGLSGWLAMEWIEGTCLGRRLQEKGQIPCKEVLELVPQIISGLSALHQADLVHRDIKPSNLLFEIETGRLVIADLGIALDLEADIDQRVTRTLEQPATPGYAPPEILSGSRPDARWDQYSLAFTLWQLLTGTMPIGAFAKLHHLCKCPDGLDAVLRKALATDPTKRFPDIDSFGQALRQAAARPPRSHFLIGILTLLVLSGCIYAFTRPDPFPKHFQSGNLRVNEGREQYMSMNLTFHENGRFIAKIRTTSFDPLFGFDGRCQLTLRDSRGNIIRHLNTDGFGVNGRFIPGAKHDRLDDWSGMVSREEAGKLKTIDFQAHPSTGKLKTRAADNQRRFRDDVASLKDGVRQGIDALTTIFSLKDPPSEKTEQSEAPPPSQ